VLDRRAFDLREYLIPYDSTATCLAVRSSSQLISEPRQRWGDPFVYYECVFVAGSPWLRAWAALAFAPASGLEAG
jgi:hypothetical protein